MPPRDSSSPPLPFKCLVDSVLLHQSASSATANSQPIREARARLEALASLQQLRQSSQAATASERAIRSHHSHHQYHNHNHQEPYHRHHRRFPVMRQTARKSTGSRVPHLILATSSLQTGESRNSYSPDGESRQQPRPNLSKMLRKDPRQERPPTRDDPA